MAVVYAVIIAFVVWAEVKILNKAGYSGWWALSMLVPIFGIVMFFVFAFSDWPVLQQLRAVSAGQTFGYAGAPPGPGVPGPGMPWGASGPGGPWGAPGPFPSSPGLPPPGWYPGEVQGQERYWDGVAWTSQVRASEPPRT